MFKFLSKILGGNKSEKDIKNIEPLVEQINTFYDSYGSLTNDEIRAKTQAFKARIQADLEAINNQIKAKQAAADSLPPTAIHEKDELYKTVDELKKEKDKFLEISLNKILPEAFALVKETARRFTENKTLVSTATEADKSLSVKKEYITIENGNAIYQNSWMAAGGNITWNMVHYDVQLIGGIVLHMGKIAEMSTGEGKTLVSTLPAYLNALSGEGVHIVTVNDYLARRDSEWNGTIFEWLGLQVDCIDKYDPNSEARRQAYKADIIYGTNNEFGFDYLRDNMVHSPEEMVQRKHHFAMIDEVDSVLIDDARTPLIISGPIGKQDNTQLFFELKPRIEKIVEAQKRAVNQFLLEAKKKIAEGNDDPKDSGLALYRAYRGLPKTSALIKFLSEPGIRTKLQKAENFYIADQQKEMSKVDDELYFYIDEKNNSVELTDKGIQLITKAGEDTGFFVLPDISSALAGVEKNEQLSPTEKLQEKELIINNYATKAERIHTVQQLLKSYTLFDKDVEYVVMDGAVKIVDEQTGRILDGRRYSDGLHQAIEAKENVHIEASTQTYATITLQNYFRMYHKLAGMTGTAETEAGELWDIYKLDVVTIPTNIPAIRKDQQDLIYKTKREKYGAVIDEIEKLRQAGRPALVGTTSVEVSELLSRMLRQKQIPHNVLNAKQHAKEAQIVAEAGLPGAITIATNMAGRGTDIKLAPIVKDAGGLAIIGTERHESRRVDRQLRGRAGRQGDPGSSQFFVALEDDLMRMFGSERIAKVMDFAGYKEGEVIQHSMITKSIERAQKKVEENNFGIRKHLLEYDDVMNKQRTVIYAKRHHALFGDRLALDLDNAFYANAEALINAFKESNLYEDFNVAVILQFGIETTITVADLQQKSTAVLTEQLYDQAIQNYYQKRKTLAQQAVPIFKKIQLQQGPKVDSVVVPFTDGKKVVHIISNIDKTISTDGEELITNLEKTITLHLIDEGWREHLRAMDDLKQSVRTATYEQKDPLVIFKMEAFTLFNTLNQELSRNIINFLSHAAIPLQEATAPLKEANHVRKSTPKMQAQKAVLDGNGRPLEENYNHPNEYSPADVKSEPMRAEKTPGRNELCPCGSGKKYKSCHGKS